MNDIQAATKLAEKYGFTLIEDPTDDEPDLLEEWEEGDNPELMPGLDIKNDIVYQTHKIKRKVTDPATKKNPNPKTHQIYSLACLTSAREIFLFEEDALMRRGFMFPKTVSLPISQRWAKKDMRAFMDKKDRPDRPIEIYAAIRKIFETYVEFEEEIFYDLMTLYVMFSYVFRAFAVTGYLHFNGTAGSGKSQCLNILEAIGFNPILAAGISESALFRSVAGNPGLILLDESESFKTERGAALRTLLLMGYKYSGTSLRSEKETKDGPWTAQQFSTYCPKAFASIETLDDTMGSRCLVVQMRPALRAIPPFPDEDEVWFDLRNQLYLWSMHHGANIKNHRIAWQTRYLTEAPSIDNRSWEVAAQFVVLADYIGEKMLAEPVIEFFSNYYKKVAEALNATDRNRVLLQALPRVIQEKTPWLSSFYSLKDIHEVATRYMDDDGLEHYRTRQVGKGLAVLGFNEKKTRSGGVHIKLEEAMIRHEIHQRRLEPFPEDRYWFEHDDATYIKEPEPEMRLSMDWNSVMDREN